MKNNKFMNSLIQLSTILLAALVVVGATYAMGQRATASGIDGERGGVERDSHDDHDDHGHSDHGHDGHGPGGFRAIAGFAKTLLPIALIVGVVTGIQNFRGTSKKKSKDEEDDNQIDEPDHA